VILVFERGEKVKLAAEGGEVVGAVAVDAEDVFVVFADLIVIEVAGARGLRQWGDRRTSKPSVALAAK